MRIFVGCEGTFAKRSVSRDISRSAQVVRRLIHPASCVEAEEDSRRLPNVRADEQDFQLNTQRIYHASRIVLPQLAATPKPRAGSQKQGDR